MQFKKVNFFYPKNCVYFWNGVIIEYLRRLANRKKEKIDMRKYIVLFSLLQFLFNFVSAQTVTYKVHLLNPCIVELNQSDSLLNQKFIDSLSVSTCNIDTLKLKVENYQYGSLQWEQSFDGINWIAISNEVDSVYSFKPTITSYYRVINKLPDCKPIVSSSVLINNIPKANAGSDRLINNNYTYLSGNKIKGVTSKWQVLEGIGGVFQSPDSAYSKFTGLPASNVDGGSTGVYKLRYTLQNECGSTSDTLILKIIQNQYYDKIIVVDATDSIMSTAEQIESGSLDIEFSDTNLIVEPQTILISIVGDGFMRKVETVSKSGNIYSFTTSQAKIDEIITTGGIDLGQLYNIESINQSLKAKGFNQLNKLPTREELKTNESLKNGTHFFVIEDIKSASLDGVTAIKQNPKRIQSNVNPDEFEEKDFFIEYNFDNIVLFEKNGIKANLDGKIVLKPNVVSKIQVDLLDPTIFIGVDNGTVAFNSTLTVEADQTSTFELNDEKIGPAIRGKLVLVIGGVPTLIQIKTQFEFDAKITTNGNITYINSYNKTYTVNAGAKYENNEYDFYFNSSETSEMNHDLKVKGSILTSFDIGPIIYFTINGATGPYVDLKMTTDLNLCASSQDLQDLNWQAEANLGGKLLLGWKPTFFGKEIFHVNKEWEERKLFNERYPYMLEYISGNNQQYTVGTPLEKPLKIRIKSMYGIPARFIMVKFEAVDNCGTLSKTTVITDAEGYAETLFTPSATGKCNIQVIAKDCDFEYLMNAPFTFIATEKTNGIDCSKTTLSASIKKLGTKIVLFGHMGISPYTYSTDLINYSTVRPQIIPENGKDYLWAVKDANGCIAFANYKESDSDCNNLTLDVAQFDNNIELIAKGGTEPYSYALDGGNYVSTASFRGLSIGAHIVKVKDGKGCEINKNIDVSIGANATIPYFTVNTDLSCYAPVFFNNLSSSGDSYLWEFGDNKTSMEVSPIHVYKVPGKYTVSLTLTNGNIQKTFTRIITVNPINNQKFNPFKASLIYYFDSEDTQIKNKSIYFDENGISTNEFNIDISEIPNGGHTLYVKAIDANGKESFIQRQSFWKDAVSINQTPNLKRIEYFFDTDPGINKGNAIPFTVGKSVDLAYTIDLTGVNNGGHTLYVRSIDENGKSSFIQRQLFWKDAVSINQTPNLKRIEYFFDTDPGINKGNAIPFTVGKSVDLAYTIDLTGVSNGGHTLYVRSIDQNGKSSFIQRQSFWKDAVSINQTPNLKRIEYFFDTDPGINKGTAIPFTAGKSVDLAYTIDLTKVNNGGHTLYVRSIDQNGKSSFIQRQSFWKDAVSINQTPNLKRIEYFFDTYPGINKGNAIPFTAGKSVDLAYTIDLTGVNNGGHTLYVRSIDQNGKSSFIQRQSFWKDAVSINQTPNLKRIEYFFDTDPGINKGNAIPFTAGKSVDLAYTIDLTGVNNGGHTLYVRSIDQNGKSSFIQRQSFWKSQSTANPNIVQIEYFVDREPDAKSIFISKQNQAPFIDTEFDVDLTGLTGKHLVYVRAKDSNGHWSFMQVQEICAGMNVDFTTDKTVYQPNETILFNINNKTSNTYTYAWDFNNTNNYVTANELTANYQFAQTGTYQVNLKITGSDGCSSVVSKSVNVSISTDNGRLISTDFKAEIYPNPTSGKVWIQMNKPLDKLHMQVYSVDGKLISSFEKRNTTTVIDEDFSSYMEGLYFIRLTDNKNVIVKRLMIKK